MTSRSTSSTDKIVRLQFGFEEDVPANSSGRDLGFVELPLPACRISGLVQMLAEMEGCGNDDDDDNNGDASSPPSVLIVGIELPGGGGDVDCGDDHDDATTTTTGSRSIHNLISQLDRKALLSVKSFLLGAAASSSTAGTTTEGGGGGSSSSVVPVPLPNAVTGVNYYLNTLLCPNDRAILVGMLPSHPMVGGSRYSVEIPLGGGGDHEEEDPMLGLKRLLHLANYLQIEPLVNLVAGYFAAAFIEICRRPATAAVSSLQGGSSGSATTTPATQAACAIRQLMRVGHDWTRDEQATITRHTDWS